MIIELDMSSSTPIYVQLRNQIVKGIGKGELKTGEKLPTVRQLPVLALHRQIHPGILPYASLQAMPV